jgi:MiaB/RimO family radical SAM methylthiotransferase
MRYYVESYGCALNYGEGDQLSERMSALGHEPAPSPDEADVIVLNTCTVVDATEKKMIRRMSELRKMGKEVVVAGCMAKAQPGRAMIRLPGSLVIPPEGYGGFSSAVEERYGRGCASVRWGSGNILPIAQGCAGACTYCITKLARGGLSSVPEAEVLERFGRMLESGKREVLVAAQDSACYGMDSGSSLPRLLGRMLEAEGDYRIRVGMMNPDMLAPMLGEMLDVFEDPRVYRFLHIPVQSGSDAVLERMGRRYTRDGFMGMVGEIRSRFPEMSIATDLIAGFPGETGADHSASVALVRELEADTVNITRFSPRPGTPAASMEQVHGRVANERSSELTRVKNEVEAGVNSRLVGRRLGALVTEAGKSGSVIARTDSYRPVVIHAGLEIGSFARVEITGCEPTYLIGRML